MVKENQDDDETGLPSGTDPQSRFPRLWRVVNSAPSPSRPFDSNVPLPKPEPPTMHAGLGANTKASQRGADRGMRLPPIGVRDDHVDPPSRADVGRSDAKARRASNPRVPKPLILAGILAGAGLLLGVSLMLLGGPDGSDSTVAVTTTELNTDPGSRGIETSTASLGKGDCILIGEFDTADPFHANVLTVSCQQPHDSEVVAVKKTPMDLQQEVQPADIASIAEFLCENEFVTYRNDQGAAERIELAPLVGSRRSLLVCVARYPDGREFINPASSGESAEPDE